MSDDLRRKGRVLFHKLDYLCRLKMQLWQILLISQEA
jgi:hypothetical protein